MEFEEGDSDDKMDRAHLQDTAGDILEKYKRAYKAFSTLNRQMDLLERRQEALGRKLSAGMIRPDVEEILGQMNDVRDRIISLRESWRSALRVLHAMRKQVDCLLDDLALVLLRYHDKKVVPNAENGIFIGPDEEPQLLKTLLLTRISDAQIKQRRER